jgi:hypothetical protein
MTDNYKATSSIASVALKDNSQNFKSKQHTSYYWKIAMVGLYADDMQFQLVNQCIIAL